MISTHALHVRLKRNPHFRIPPVVKSLYKQCAMLSAPMDADRNLQEDYSRFLAFVKGDMHKNPHFGTYSSK
jgi:hypothetical protein